MTGFILGWFWGILTTLGAIGVGCVLKDRRLEMERRQWNEDVDSLLWTVGRKAQEERKRRNDERVLGAVRDVISDRQDVAWKN